MPRQTNDQRDEFRRALRDELATVRVLNQSLKLTDDHAERHRLTTARADSLAVLRYLLTQLFPRKAEPNGHR
jgi:hypothetical protein